MTPNIKTELPFSVSVTNQELWENISKFDMDKYKDNIRTFLQDVGMIFDGNASQRVVDVVVDAMKAISKR